MEVSAIVLAGGRSTRFGRDKLAERLDGVSVLDRTIAAVQRVAGDVVVVCAPGDGRTLPPDVRVARDEIRDGGPLIGLAAGLAAARQPAVVVVGGDMPWIRPDVLLAMLDALDPAHPMAILSAAGRAQQLPLALERSAGLDAVTRLVASGERRLGALIDTLASAVLAEAEWRAVDPDGATLRDIDEPEDLPGAGPR